MGRYIDRTALVGKYDSVSRVNSATIDSYHIYYAEFELDAQLGGFFTTPFSSNNVTAKDLALDMAYLRAVGHGKDDDYAKSLREALAARMQRLKDGEEPMLTDSGESIYSVGHTVYSTTGGYHPTFGMDDVENLQVDSSMTYDEQSDRGQL